MDNTRPAFFNRLSDDEKLIYYDQTVDDLRSSINTGEEGLEHTPSFLKTLIEGEMWKKRLVVATDKIAEFDSFEEFVTGKGPNGLHISIKTLQRLCRDRPDVLDLMDRAMQRPPSIHNSDAFDNIQGTKLEMAPTGTSSAASLRRLRKDRPDLHEQVIAGVLSPNKAMIEAGFRAKAVQFYPDDINRTAQILKHNLSADQFQSLIDLMRKS